MRLAKPDGKKEQGWEHTCHEPKYTPTSKRMFSPKSIFLKCVPYKSLGMGEWRELKHAEGMIHFIMLLLLVILAVVIIITLKIYPNS